MFGTRVPKRYVDLVPGAQTIPAREIAAIDSLTTPVEIEEGRVLMRQGAPGNDAESCNGSEASGSVGHSAISRRMIRGAET